PRPRTERRHPPSNLEATRPVMREPRTGLPITNAENNPKLNKVIKIARRFIVKANTLEINKNYKNQTKPL
ncbi:hypothetical protein, partial [Rubrivivax gelatinosus]|uniref:hypothetical protein n=1 Tax=Rubrivivax gelatinosus TaxID=28068 RepID=UPI001A924BF3